MTSATFHYFIYTDRHTMKLTYFLCWLATLPYLNTCDGLFHLSHHVFLADVLRHMSTASLSRNPADSSDCRNKILQFSHLAKINLRINTVATSSNYYFVPSMDRKFCRPLHHHFLILCPGTLPHAAAALLRHQILIK